MARLALTRILTSIVAIFGASVLSFVFLRLAPGDPVGLVLGQFATPEAVAKLTHELRLDEPVLQQYAHYITAFLRGDWGFSYSNGQPVRTLMGARLPASIELALFAFAFTIVGATSLALVSTYRRRRGLSRAVDTINFLGLGLPQFWLGLMLLVLFSQDTHIFPGPEGRLGTGVSAPHSITGLYTVDALLTLNFSVFFDAFWHLLLPGVVLGLHSMAFLCRVLQANLDEVGREPYVLVAEGKGLSRWQAFIRHALPNALVPSLTASGVLLGLLLSGGVLVETTFQWPGVGALVTAGVGRQDFSIVQAFVLLSAIVFVLVNLVVDLLIARIDPRIREGAAR
jgi:peptide/nickel transport system permease protein